MLGPARFARDYAGARDRFLEAPARSGGLMRGVELSAPGPAGESLGTDVLLLGDSGARKLLIITGGAPTASTLRRYSAFGVPGEAAPAHSIERGFASRPIEGASGLVYMRARHYDPTTGRFLQPDPEGIASTQRYAFAEHNPYIYEERWADMAPYLSS